GSAGGSTAGGSAGGSTAGGSAGGSTAGGSAGGSTAGGSAGGSTAGGSAGGSTAGGSAGGSTAGGSAGGSTAGGSAGGSTAGGSAGGSSADGGALVMVTLPNSRFIGIAQVAVGAAPTQTASATVREPIDGGSSILEGWAANGSATPSRTRLIPWMGGYRATAIASNTNQIAMAVQSSFGLSVELMDSSFVNAGFSSLETGVTDAGISRLAMVPGMSAVFAFVQGQAQGQGNPSGSARFFRAAPGTALSTAYSPMDGGVAYGDDIIDASLPNTPRLLLTSRCPHTCSFGGTAVTTTGLAGRFALMTYDPNTFSLPSVATHESVEVARVPFARNEVLRAASDGSTFFYLAGQGSTGELTVERRSAASGMRGNEWTSTGALRLVDIRRSPNGSAVVLLATYEAANVSFNMTTFPHTSGNQRNVVVIRIDAGGTVTSTAFNLPGDQQAVGFAGGGNSFLHIAINQGSDAVLWRIPEP
ncbi:MAG: hypothetical protein Q8N26_34740, partial [Myxococcales bacterium]|nr:hypothetical protein [Myxococcales bacterium]